MEKEEKTNALSLFIPRIVKNIHYSRKIKVADIKQYLVDEYKLTKELDKENKTLRKEIDNLNVVKEKYDLTLITLNEYKDRLKDKNETIKEMQESEKRLKQDLKIVKDEKNTLIIAQRKLQKDNDKVLKEFKSSFIKNLVKIIRNTKGTLSKQKVCEIIEQSTIESDE